MFEIADYFNDEKISNILLSKIPVNSDNLAFAWKQETLKNEARAFLQGDAMVYTIENVINCGVISRNFFRQTMNMTMNDLINFLGELKENEKIDDQMYAYLLVQWVDSAPNYERKRIALEISELLAKNEFYEKTDNHTKRRIYSFLTAIDDIEKDAVEKIHMNLYNEPILENSEKRKMIINRILESKQKDSKSIDPGVTSASNENRIENIQIWSRCKIVRTYKFR